MAAHGRRLNAPPAPHRLLAGLRLGLGVAGLAAPGVFLRGLGVDTTRQPAAPYLLRIFAVRNVWLAVHLLRPGAAGPRTQGVLDLADATAALLARSSGQLPPRRAALAAGAGVVATVLAAAPSTAHGRRDPAPGPLPQADEAPSDRPGREGGAAASDVQVTVDCADPARLAAFWAEVLGYRLQDPPAGFATWQQALDAMGVPPERRNDASAVVDPAGVGPRLFFQRVSEQKQVKNRVHLDVRAAPGLDGDARMAALEAEADRLVAHGATRLARHDPAPPLGAGHLVLADPEGNEFCLD